MDPASRHEPGDPLRQRIEREEGLLASRTHAFLLLNGIGLVALSLSTDFASSVIMIVAFLVGDALWLCSSLQSRTGLLALQARRADTGGDAADVVVRGALSGWPERFRACDIQGLYLPSLVVLGWIAGLTLLLTVVLGR